MKHLSMIELESGWKEMHPSPKDDGMVELIVRRPQPGAREILNEATLDPVDGLLGDGWKNRKSTSTPDGSPNPDMQLTLMNSRVIALIAGDRERWPLAGDQLFVNLDLSRENLPPGTRLALGSALIEITAPPHTGCKKFVERFGEDAMTWTNSPTGRQLNWRGVNARVIKGGTIKVGDTLRKT